MHHRCSYDKATRSAMIPISFPVLDPVQKHATNDTHHLNIFRPDQFKEVTKKNTLVPDKILHARAHFTASKETACFMLLHR